MYRILDWTLEHPAWGVCITGFFGLSLGAKSDYGLIPILVYLIWYVGCFVYMMARLWYFSNREGPDDDPDRKESVAELIEIEDFYHKRTTTAEAA